MQSKAIALSAEYSTKILALVISPSHQVIPNVKPQIQKEFLLILIQPESYQRGQRNHSKPSEHNLISTGVLQAYLPINPHTYRHDLSHYFIPSCFSPSASDQFRQEETSYNSHQQESYNNGCSAVRSSKKSERQAKCMPRNSFVSLPSSHRNSRTQKVSAEFEKCLISYERWKAVDGNGRDG